MEATKELNGAQKKALYVELVQRLNQRREVRFLLVRNFQTPEHVGIAFRRYKKNGGTRIVGILKCGDYAGYAVVVSKGIPDFMMLSEMNLHPVRRDHANWRPRCWQNEKGGHFGYEGRNYRNYDLADNLYWPHISEIIEIILKDSAIELIYK